MNFLQSPSEMDEVQQSYLSVTINVQNLQCCAGISYSHQISCVSFITKGIEHVEYRLHLFLQHMQQGLQIQWCRNLTCIIK